MAICQSPTHPIPDLIIGGRIDLASPWATNSPAVLPAGHGRDFSVEGPSRTESFPDLLELDQVELPDQDITVFSTC